MEGFDIVKEVYDAKAKTIKNYPCYNNRASEIGHPCVRYLVYNRLNWQEKILYPTEVGFIYDGGNMIHELARKQIETCETIKLVEQEASFEWREYKITGRMDGKITKDHKTRYPLEIKGISHWDWLKINCMEDMLYADKSWLRKYPAQLMIYMLQTSMEYGLFYLVSKTTFQPKAIWMRLHEGDEFQFAEGLLKKAEKVNACVDKNEYPDRIEYDHNVCVKCDFAHLCLPDIKNQAGLDIVDNEELENLLKERDENSFASSKYDKADKQIKAIVKGKEKILCGDFLITGKTSIVEKKEQPARTEEQWRVKIINLNKEKIIKNKQQEE
jgi:hypothetical protein